MTIRSRLICQKGLFDIPDHMICLNAAYMSPILKEAAPLEEFL